MPFKKGQVGNPNGRPAGKKNRNSFDVKKKLAEYVDNNFISGLIADINAVESVKDRAALKIKVVDYFVPKPKDIEDEELSNQVRVLMMERLGIKNKE